MCSCSGAVKVLHPGKCSIHKRIPHHLPPRGQATGKGFRIAGLNGLLWFGHGGLSGKSPMLARMPLSQVRQEHDQAHSIDNDAGAGFEVFHGGSLLSSGSRFLRW